MRQLLALLLFMGLPGGWQAPAPPRLRAANPSPVHRIAPGVTYQHMETTAPNGGPWSIHVLRMAQNRRDIFLRAEVGTDTTGQMQRVLPSALAARAVRPGEQVLGVVNGDYDMGEPYLGISDGLTITSGRLWTTGKPDWPTLALLRSGRPVIAVPQVRIEVRAAGKTWIAGALNKPLGSGHGAETRLFTREYRDALKSQAAFNVVELGRLAPALPLEANREVRAEVLDTHEGVHEAAIPSGGMILAWRRDVSGSLAQLKRGTKVRIRFRVRMEGKGDVHDAVGGFPILVEHGRRSIVGTPSAYLSQRHPRTAVCYTANEIVFVVVDGRQPQLSVGMTLEDLADLMVRLGCTKAMNTDGGGSSVMAVALSGNNSSTAVGAELAPPALRIVNSPSDGRERGRGNAWVISRGHRK